MQGANRFNGFFKEKIKSEFYGNYSEEKTGPINSFEDIVNTIELANLNASAPEEESQEATPLVGGQDLKKASDDQRALAYSRLRAIFLLYADWVAALPHNQRPEDCFAKDYLDQVKKAIDEEGRREFESKNQDASPITWHHDHYQRIKYLSWAAAVGLTVGETFAAICGLEGFLSWATKTDSLPPEWAPLIALVAVSAMYCNFKLLKDDVADFIHQAQLSFDLVSKKKESLGRRSSKVLLAILAFGASAAYGGLTFRGLRTDDFFGLCFGHSKNVLLNTLLPAAFSAFTFFGMGVLFYKGLTAFKNPFANKKLSLNQKVLLGGIFVVLIPTLCAMFALFQTAFQSLLHNMASSYIVGGLAVAVYALFSTGKVAQLLQVLGGEETRKNEKHEQSAITKANVLGAGGIFNCLAYCLLPGMAILSVEGKGSLIEKGFNCFMHHGVHGIPDGARLAIAIVVTVGAFMLSFAPQYMNSRKAVLSASAPQADFSPFAAATQ